MLHPHRQARVSPASPRERSRLAALHRYGILDSSPEPEFDDLALLASRVFAVPIAVVSLVDRHRVWFKAKLGIDASFVEREISFASRVVEADVTVVVEDARADPLCATHPLVTGEPDARFYAGAPIRSHEGLAVGVFAIVDHVPRTMSAVERDTLERMANQAAALIERHYALDRMGRVVADNEGLLEKVEHEHARLELAAEAAELGWWEWLVPADVVRVGGRLRRLFGLEEGDVEQTPDSLCARIHPEDCGAFRGALDDALAHAAGFEVEFRVVHRDGGVRWLAATGRPTHAASGRPLTVSGIVRDVTARRESEAALRESEAKLRAIIDHSPSLINLRAPDGRYLAVNRHYVEVFGKPESHWVGKRSADLWPAPAAERMMAHFSAVVQSKRPLTIEDETPYPDGPRRTLVTRFPILLADGSVAAVGTISTDVTELERARARILETEERFRALSDAAPMMIRMLGADAQCTFCNLAWLEFTGRSEDDEAGDGWLAGVHPEDRPHCVARLREAHGDRAVFELRYRLRRNDGEERHIVEHAAPRFAPDGQFAGFMATGIDVTELVLTMRALGASESRLAAVVDSAMDAIIFLDATQRVTLFNPAAERLLGYRPSDVLGRPVDLLIPERHRSAHRDQVERFGRDGSTVRRMGALGTVNAVHRDGHEIQVEASIASTRLGDEPAYAVIMRDATARVAAERAHARAEALAAACGELEAFSCAAAHDLKAPLRAIMGFSAMLLDQDGAHLPASLRDPARRIHGNAQRMGVLIDRLLELGRLARTPLREQPFNCAVLVREALAQVTGVAADERADVHVRADCSAFGDRALLRQVFTNLLDNARKFSRRSPAPRIEVTCDRVGDRVACEVRDNGVGFDAADAARLGRPFTRLHPASEFEGTGLGLAIADRILALHGSALVAEPAAGGGASFRFTLPAGDAGAAGGGGA